MTYKKATWIAALKKAIVDSKHEDRPTASKPCAIATIRYIRDGLCDDIGEKSEDDKALCATIREGCNELIQQVSKEGADSGFASNASAAAKAAGFKSTTVSSTELVD